MNNKIIKYTDPASKNGDYSAELTAKRKDDGAIEVISIKHIKPKKYLRLTSIGQGKTPSLLTSYIVEVADGTLEKGMRIFLNSRLFDIGTVINKPGNPKTRITGNFV